MPVSLPVLLSSAPYVAELHARHETWLSSALPDPDHALGAVLLDLDAARLPASSEEAVGRQLRDAKGKVALLAAVSEVTGLWTAAQSTAALSDLADAALQAGLEFLMRVAVERGDVTAPTTADGCGLALFALGKHGGRELNYSSDIDIIAFFDPERAPLKDRSEATRFYTRIVQRLAALMQDRTDAGYVFRTDLRLRPDPGATPVALPIEAALTYYESRGQNWERAAWIKARPCAGDKVVGEAFLRELAPYIWRKHLDFATIADIQAMKRQINIAKNVGDVRVEGHNVKLGLGGIREIEFFTQTQQLIAGGRDPTLRVRPTSDGLSALAAAGWINDATARDLTETYWFLRAVENRLQMLRDEQTHTMPETEEGIAVIAALMGGERAAFEARYRGALARVVGYYQNLFVEGETLGAAGGNLVFTGSDDDPGTLETLGTMGFKNPAKVSATVRKWHYGGYAATRAAAARAHLTELLPALLETLAATGNADEAMERFDNFLGRLPSGVQLFTLLRQHERLRTLLVALLASAPRMAEAVIHRAHVMDALIDPAFTDEVRRSRVLRLKIESFLDEARAYEEVIDRARIIGQEQMFLISAGLLAGVVDAARTGEQFTTLAQTLLGRLFATVRGEFVQRHGVVPGARVALLAFGKLASREMTARSDLDLFMLYDAEAEESDGPRSLPTSQYYARLTQRLIAAVSARTSEGVLYEIDMRLRPSGNAGPVATSLRSFLQYQQESAWTWERLALTRARVVVADDGFGENIETGIDEALNDEPRDAGKIVDDVLDMRARLARDRAPRHPFDLKLVPGGLMDLEFMAQSAQLIARSQIAAPRATTARTLTRLGEVGSLPEAERLIAIHATYSTVLQVMSAALASPFKDEGWTASFRELLAQRTNTPSFERLAVDLKEMQADVQTAAASWYARAKGFTRDR